MNDTSHSHDRALVLGGGGAAGNAWLIGVLAALADGGVDARTAELTIGTSAGATAVAQLIDTDPRELYDVVLHAPVPQRPAQLGPITDHLDRFRQIIASSADAGEMRRRMGQLALQGGDASRWRDLVAARFTARDWPARRIQLTAVDAHTGEGVALDRHSGVDLVDAVAASTSGGGAAYAVGDARYIDGGYRRNENADLAAGYSRVLVLSPLGGRTLHPLEWGMQLDAQVAELRAGGSSVETILPDEAALAAFDGTMMDARTRPAAARAGHAHGSTLAPRLKEWWG